MALETISPQKLYQMPFQKGKIHLKNATMDSIQNSCLVLLSPMLDIRIKERMFNDLENVFICLDGLTEFSPQFCTSHLFLVMSKDSRIGSPASIRGILNSTLPHNNIDGNK